jgi:hypothetical protein
MSTFSPRLRLIGDISAAGGWLRERVIDGGVGDSLIPGGFDAYVQVLHPADGPGISEVSWREVAEWAGVPLQPGVWFQDLEELPAPNGAGSRPWEDAPMPGEIPDEIRDALMEILVRHTAAGEATYALWDGWGSLNGSMWRSVAYAPGAAPPPGTPTESRALPAVPSDVPKLSLPGRDYILLAGPLDAIAEVGVFVEWDPPAERSFSPQPPSLWWPADRAWCAGVEVDAGFTCIGGSRALVDELLAEPSLETLELTRPAAPPSRGS